MNDVCCFCLDDNSFELSIKFECCGKFSHKKCLQQYVFTKNNQNIINCPLCRHEILIRPLLKHFIHRKEFIINIILCIQYIYLNVILLFFFFHYTYNLPRRSIFNFFTNVFMIFLISNTTFTMVTIFKDILKKTYILLS